MSRWLPIAVIVVLVVGSVLPPRTVLASPIVLTFENSDIETFTRAVSEIVGFSYVLAPDVRGKVTVQTTRAIRQEDVFAVFLSILQAHGFTAVKEGEIYKIVRTTTSLPDGGPSPGTTLAPDHLVTQVIGPRFASAATPPSCALSSRAVAASSRTRGRTCSSSPTRQRTLAGLPRS